MAELLTIYYNFSTVIRSPPPLQKARVSERRVGRIMPNLGRSHATGFALAQVCAVRVLLANNRMRTLSHAPSHRRNDHCIGL